MPRPLSAEARTKALDAAAALLGDEGIDGFTVDEVARRSGVAKSTLYRHWNSGNELLMEALDCHIEQIPTPDTGRLFEDLAILFENLNTLIAEEGNRRLMLDMLAAAARDPELDQIKRAMMSERTSPIGVIVSRAVERGEIPAVELDQALACIHGPFMAHTMMHGDPLDRSNLLQFVAFVVRGLGGQTPEG